MNPGVTVNEVWEHLAEGQWIELEQPPEMPETERTEIPWYLAGLVGLSGWVAAGFLIGFLALADLLDDNQTMLFLGIAFCLVALAVKFIGRHAIFPSQLAFALSLAGQGLIIGSQFESTEISQIIATILILEGILFLVYPDALHRLISLAAIIIAVIVQMADWSWIEQVPLVALILTVGAFVVWWQQIPMLLSRFRTFFAPLAVGLPTGAIGLCIVQLPPFAGWVAPWWTVAVGAAILLLLLGGLILRELDLPPLSLILLGLVAFIALLMIPAYKTPGVMVAVLMIGMAYWRNNRLLLGIGILSLLLFISFYYYYLELTLLTKSLILMGSGAGFLLLRVGLGWLVKPVTEQVEVNV